MSLLLLISVFISEHVAMVTADNEIICTVYLLDCWTSLEMMSNDDQLYHLYVQWRCVCVCVCVCVRVRACMRMC